MKERFAECRIEIARLPKQLKKLVLFVTHAPNSQIKPHVPLYIKSLTDRGLSVIVVVVADDPTTINQNEIPPFCDGVILRGNQGYDFGAWAHVVEFLDLEETELLILANDSVVGPIDQDSFDTLLSRIEASSAALIGMTDSYEVRYHFQSYFVAVKNEGVVCLRKFLEKVTILRSKDDVIQAYEVRLRDAFISANLPCSVLFPTPPGFIYNSSLLAWEALAYRGFPFIKTSIFQALPRDNWLPVVQKTGYPLPVIDRTVQLLGGISQENDANGQAIMTEERFRDVEALRKVLVYSRDSDQSPEKEGLLPETISDSGTLKRYVKYGFYRLLILITRKFMPSAALKYEKRAHRTKNDVRKEPSILTGALPFISDKPSVLVVSHDASRSGAPILAMNVAWMMSRDYNVSMVSLAGGEMADDFSSVCEQIFIVSSRKRNGSHFSAFLRSAIGHRSFDFAVVNSIQSRDALAHLKEAGIPAVLLLHEFASYIQDSEAFTTAIGQACETIFSTRLTLHNAIQCGLPDETPFIHLVPQGQCVASAEKIRGVNRQQEINQVRQSMISKVGASRRFIVLGAGQIEYRKGVDLFVETAAQIARNPFADHVHFIWFGAGFAPEGPEPGSYASFIHDQIRRARVEDRVTFMPPTSEIDSAYDFADALLVTSRLDPLPNVAIDAACKGLPVLGFAGANGMSELLADAGFGEECVADYMDTSQIADKIAGFATDPKRVTALSERIREWGQATFDMQEYGARISELGARASARLRARSESIDRIAAAKGFDPGFFNPAASKVTPRRNVARAYLERSHIPGMSRRPEPGFNPFVYAEMQDQAFDLRCDPYVDYLSRGQPDGPWKQCVIKAEKAHARQSSLSAALHIHAYFPDALADCVARLGLNGTRPDLFVSVKDTGDADRARRLLSGYGGAVRAIEPVPNIGRDIGPFLTLFARNMAADYEITGHMHLKESRHVESRSAVEAWTKLLMENMLGGASSGAMVDTILRQFEHDDHLGLVYPDDPHLIGWGRNRVIAEDLAVRHGLGPLPRFFDFPVGTMFWMRARALEPFVAIGLDWKDYPAEPVADDGTLLHALERLFGSVPREKGWKTAVTHVAGISR